MPRFAANLSMMFHEHPFLERFQAAANTGFAAVEYLFPYDFPAKEIREALDKAGLFQALFNIGPGNWAAGDRGLAALPQRRSEFVTKLEQALDYAKVIETPHLHMMAGIAPHDDANALASYLECLKIAADKAGSAGITVLIEPINMRDMPGYFLNDFNRAIDIIDQLNMPNIKLQFDVYHRQILHGDVIMALRKMMPAIGHIQIASVPQRNEPNSGELDDRRIFSEIDALGYQGYVGCEYRPKAGTNDGLEWFQPYAP